MKQCTTMYWKKWTKKQTNQKTEKKTRQFAQQVLKEGPIESQLTLPSSPDHGTIPQLILTKHKQLCTIDTIGCYHI